MTKAINGEGLRRTATILSIILGEVTQGLPPSASSEAAERPSRSRDTSLTRATLAWYTAGERRSDTLLASVMKHVKTGGEEVDP